MIAILLMILDHALLFFVPDGVWPGVIRLTLTRCAEPLFVFVFAYLTIYLRRPMKWSRWGQVAVVSVMTSTILSSFLGYAVADVLVSIAVVAPFLPLLLKLPGPIATAFLYATAVLAVLPIEFAGIAFDYSPLLIAHQVLLTRLHCEAGFASAAKHGGLSLALSVLATGVASSLGVSRSPGVFVFLFGHPLAALIIRVVQNRSEHRSTPLGRFAKRPLTVYATHLLGFTLVAAALR